MSFVWLYVYMHVFAVVVISNILSCFVLFCFVLCDGCWYFALLLLLWKGKCGVVLVCLVPHWLWTCLWIHVVKYVFFFFESPSCLFVYTTLVFVIVVLCMWCLYCWSKLCVMCCFCCWCCCIIPCYAIVVYLLNNCSHLCLFEFPSVVFVCIDVFLDVYWQVCVSCVHLMITNNQQ